MQFCNLLAPHDEETFFADYWERKPFHIVRAQRDYFKELLTLETLNTIFSQLMFRADECKVARDGKIVPQSAYVSEPAMRVMERTATDYVNTTHLLGLFAQGATLVLSQLNHKWRPLEILKQEMEKHLSATVITNVFLSNRNAQGFSAHYDSHDVFVLQLHGTKIWSLYDSPIELPLKSQAFGHTPVEKGRLVSEITLSAGDVLYVPRGYFHEAKTADAVSLHLTLGVHPYLWVDYLGDLINGAGHRVPSLRKSVPRNFLALQDTDRLTYIRHALSELLDAPGLGNLIYASAIGRKLESSIYSAPDQLNEILASRELTARSRLARRDNNVRIVAERQGNVVAVNYLGRSLLLPFSQEPMIEAVRAKAEFTIAELPGAVSIEQKINFAKKLIGAGMLVTMPDTTPEAPAMGTDRMTLRSRSIR
ncbi:MAG: cupin domain-containing protein [Gammaproteobacteria bacterium]